MSESVLIPEKYGTKLTCTKPIHSPNPYVWVYKGNRPFASCPICRSQIVVSPKRKTSKIKNKMVERVTNPDNQQTNSQPTVRHRHNSSITKNHVHSKH